MFVVTNIFPQTDRRFALDDPLHVAPQVDAGEEALQRGGRQELGVAGQHAGCQQLGQPVVGQQGRHCCRPRSLRQDPGRGAHHCKDNRVA